MQNLFLKLLSQIIVLLDHKPNFNKERISIDFQVNLFTVT